MKKIIPCLDLFNGRVVKGVQFVDLVDAGDPVEIANRYNAMGADEIVFLDISATNEKRKTMLDVIRAAAKDLTVPLTVGGGIASLEDIESVLKCGASRVSLNSAAVNNASLIESAAKKFGSDCIVIAIDVKKAGGRYNVLIGGGKVDTGIDAVKWAKRVEKLGAGQILLTSMDADGTKSGYDLEITRLIAESVSLPVIASGGAGKMSDFYDALTVGKADGALAASLFHFKEVDIIELKKYLLNRNVQVKI